jgi:hypothetical protein
LILAGVNIDLRVFHFLLCGDGNAEYGAVFNTFHFNSGDCSTLAGGVKFSLNYKKWLSLLQKAGSFDYISASNHFNPLY